MRGKTLGSRGSQPGLCLGSIPSPFQPFSSTSHTRTHQSASRGPLTATCGGCGALQVGKQRPDQSTTRWTPPEREHAHAPPDSRAPINGWVATCIYQPKARLEQYEFLSCVGEGQFARAWLCRDLQDGGGRLVCVKAYKDGHAAVSPAEKPRLDRPTLAWACEETGMWPAQGCKAGYTWSGGLCVSAVLAA